MIDNLRPQTNSLNSKKVGVLQFYFDNHDSNNQTPDDVIRSLLKQLVYQTSDNEFPQRLGELYDTQLRQGKSAEPNRDQFTGLLGDCMSNFTTVYICIDALDECTQDEAVKILKCLQQLPSRKCRLFITGRTYLLEVRNIRKDYETRIWLRDASYQAISATRTDIETYLNQRLQEDAESKPYMEKSRSRIVEAISLQSNGQYTPCSFP